MTANLDDMTDSVMFHAAIISATNADKWYYDLSTGKRVDRCFGEVIALMRSELSEALEANRKGMADRHVPTRSGESVELADVLIRILDTLAHERSTVFKSFKDLPASFANPLSKRALVRHERYVKCGAAALMSSAKTEIAKHRQRGSKEDSFGLMIAQAHHCLSEALEDRQNGGNGHRALADAVVCVLAICAVRDIDIGGAFIDKCRYNMTRKDHKAENRKKVGGKKY